MHLTWEYTWSIEIELNLRKIWSLPDDLFNEHSAWFAYEAIRQHSHRVFNVHLFWFVRLDNIKSRKCCSTLSCSAEKIQFFYHCAFADHQTDLSTSTNIPTGIIATFKICNDYVWQQKKMSFSHCLPGFLILLLFTCQSRISSISFLSFLSECWMCPSFLAHWQLDILSTKSLSSKQTTLNQTKSKTCWS